MWFLDGSFSAIVWRITAVAGLPESRNRGLSNEPATATVSQTHCENRSTKTQPPLLNYAQWLVSKGLSSVGQENK
jgi:hypothetical protein